MSKRQAGGASDNFVEVQPNAARTLSALREMGYDSFSAIMDLVDNSIDAGAEKIVVTIKEAGKDRIIQILDDGKGMDKDILEEALRLGSNVEHYDPAKRLGKFGMGLVTASISLARNIWIVTRMEGKPAYEAVFDLNTVERENKFLITLKAADSRRVWDTVGDQGTMVQLSMVDRINDTNVPRFAANLRIKMGQVYRHYLERGLVITVNNKKVERYDPLMLDHPETERVLDTELDLGDGTTARLIAVELPDLGTVGDSEANIFPHNSGFYVVRNGREIIAGDTFGFYRHHHSYSHFRAELSYTGNSTAFHEDIKKASIHPDDRLLEKLRKHTERLIADSGRRSRERGDGTSQLRLTPRAVQEAITSRLPLLAQGPRKDVLQAIQKASASMDVPPLIPVKTEPPKKRGRPTKEEVARREEERKRLEEERAKLPPQPELEFIEVEMGDGRFFTAETKDNKMVIQYNSRHPFVRLAAESKQPKVAAVLGMVAVALAKAEADIPEGKKLVQRMADYLALLAAPVNAG